MFLEIVAPAILIGGLILLARRSSGMPGGPGPAMQFTQKKSKICYGSSTGVFDDVAGVNEAKDLEEVVAFLKNLKNLPQSNKNSKRGFISWTTGTGKTLLAKAVLEKQEYLSFPCRF